MKSPKKSKQTSETIEKISSIDDLLKEILVKLPLRPLFRFNLVSKQWNSIISDPKFQCMHNRIHNNNRAVGLIYQTKVVPFERSSNPPPKIHKTPDSLVISHSCNGLLIFKSAEAPKHYYVYNPTTNKQTTTPLLRDEIEARPQNKVVGMYLAFDPSKSPHYKVVCVWDLDGMHQYEFDVYSSESGSWEIRTRSFTGNVSFHNGVYWNGAIHWFSATLDSFYLNVDDHDDEMPHVMPHLPIHQGWPKYYFGESCGHLHCAVFFGENLSRGIFVYEMRKDYSEWFLKYSVDGHWLLRNNAAQKLSCVVRGKRDEDDSFLVLGNDFGEFWRYNLVHKTCEIIHDNDFVFNRNSLNRSLQYIESPCSV